MRSNMAKPNNDAQQILLEEMNFFFAQNKRFRLIQIFFENAIAIVIDINKNIIKFSFACIVEDVVGGRRIIVAATAIFFRSLSSVSGTR